MKIDYVTRAYTLTNIDWDFPVDIFPYPDLPSEVEGWEVRGYDHWTEDDWKAEAIGKVSDAYCWSICSAQVGRAY